MIAQLTATRRKLRISFAHLGNEMPQTGGFCAAAVPYCCFNTRNGAYFDMKQN